MTFQKIEQFQIAATFALLCLTQATLGFPASESESYYGYQRPMQYNNNRFYNQQPRVNAEAGSNFGAFPLRPEDESALQELGPEAIETGKKALNIATNLVKDVFPREGPIVRNGEIQTKWGNYVLPNPQDADIVEKLLSATRDMIQRMPIVE